MRNDRDPRDRPLFSFLPQPLAFDARSHNLKPIEIAVVAAILVLARLRLQETRHEEAFEAGAEKIARQRVGAKGIKWIDGLNEATAGQLGYSNRLRQLRQTIPKSIVVDVAGRATLLRLAGLSLDTKNRRAIGRILRKLSNVTFSQMPPLIRTHRLVGSRLRLYVSGAWLRPPFKPVPLPLPVKSYVATNLLLFLQCVPTNEEGESSSFKSLCERLCIDENSRPNQAFHRGLDVLNEYLARLDPSVLAALPVPPPAKYRVIATENRLRIVKVDRVRKRVIVEQEPVNTAPARPLDIDSLDYEDLATYRALTRQGHL